MQQVVLDGQKPHEAKLMPGVPQGSVLGPYLYLYYINDMAENLSPSRTVRFFVDNTTAYLAVTPAQDAELLQQNLSKLGNWQVSPKEMSSS